MHTNVANIIDHDAHIYSEKYKLLKQEKNKIGQTKRRKNDMKKTGRPARGPCQKGSKEKFCVLSDRPRTRPELVRG